MTAQLDLLAGLPAPAPENLAAAIARARAFVDRQRRLCRDCGEDERELVFLHRRRQPGSQAVIARLVQLGVSNRRLALEIADCVVLCRRCVPRRVRPYLLRSGRRGSDWGSGERSQTGIRGA